MRIDFNVQWQTTDSDQELDQRLLPLLEEIHQSGSLQAAAKETNVSYRTAWELIRYWNEAFHTPLCIKERGRGSKLSTLGQKLVETKRNIDADYAKTLLPLADKLNDEINELIGQNMSQQRCIVSCSHDLAINHLQSICEKTGQYAIEFQSRGSLENLKLLNADQIDIAGFHFPEGPLVETLAPIYSQWLDDDDHILIQLATREQGLMINPVIEKHVSSIKGITRRSLKFLNRQKGSGTRAIFDALIKSHSINKKDVRGYEKEEFTHTAVAAMIASGHADVGFGLKAAAIEFGLSFIPLITENYIIAMKKSLPKSTIESFRILMKDKKLKDKINKLPGYSTKLTGKVIHAHKLLSTPNA
jgi:putative molybdopterin biosynthesis protein